MKLKYFKIFLFFFVFHVVIQIKKYLKITKMIKQI